MISMFNIHFAVLLLYFLISTHASIVRIQNDPNLRYTPGELTIAVDPPDGFESPTGLGVFVQASTPTAIIFYTISWAVLGFTDIPEAYPEYDEFYQFDTIDKENAIVINTTTYVAFNNTPYVHIDTPYNKARNVRLRVIAVDVDIDGDYFRSDEYFFNYIVEGSDRPLSYGFLVPGPETSGNFVSFSIEMKATARAQSAGGQEYSDFFSDLGIGTYPSQVVPLKLTDIVPGLTGFEGGFAVNMTNGKHYGVLVPYHNGVDFHGRVVRVDLQRLRRDEDGGDAAACAQSVRIEAIDKNGTLRTFGETTENACVTILDLGTKHPLAKGFRKGFVGYPYGYLAAGTYNVVVRLDMESKIA